MKDLATPDPAALQRVRDLFPAAAFVADVGITLEDLGGGWVTSVLDVGPRHGQAQGVIHAGVQVTMADHTAGGAATTLLPLDKVVLTVELKINMLRPATGDRLRCVSSVLKPGRSLSIVESEVFFFDRGKPKLAAKAMLTMAVIPAPPSG